MAAVGAGKTSPGAQSDRPRRGEERPAAALDRGLGRGEHAGAGAHRAARHPTRRLTSIALLSKLRVYSISDQDDAGPWIRREFPALHYIALPSSANGEQYSYATWTGISGDRFYRNGSGADFSTFTDQWVDAQHPREGAARPALSRTRAASTRATRRRSSA